MNCSFCFLFWLELNIFGPDFIDTAMYRGKYHEVADALPNVEFVNTSKWWSNHINSLGLKSHFCRMWILPEHCSVGSTYEQRLEALVFRGQLHPFRQTIVNDLQRLGVFVNVKDSTSFIDYINWLRTVRSYLHDESDEWLFFCCQVQW